MRVTSCAANENIIHAAPVAFVRTLKTLRFVANSSNALYSVSRRVKTCAGSRTLLHAVNPDMSANSTVVSGNLRVQFIGNGMVSRSKRMNT